MATLFSRIIAGELPGRFVWKDEKCVAFLTISPLAPGHTLVVPREEIDHWLDMPAELTTHVMAVSQFIGKGIQKAFEPLKVGMMIAGLEVPHVHVHLVPIRTLRDMDFENQDRNPDPKDLDAAAEKLRASLRALGFNQVADR